VGGGGHGDIIEDPSVGSNVIFLMIPASPRTLDNGGVIDRPEPGTIPTGPGAYLFKDAEGRVIYVGKAKGLRSRLSNYFGPPASMPERTRQMVAVAESV